MSVKEILKMNHFISYELALNLKKMGFNEPCFAWYTLAGGGAKEMPKFAYL